MGVQFPGKKRYVTLEWPLCAITKTSGSTMVKNNVLITGTINSNHIQINKV